MQVMTIEFARNELGLTGANSTEFDPATPHPVIDLMDSQRDVTDKGGTMRLGAYIAELAEGRRWPQAYGKTVVSERHRHRYEFNPRYRGKFEGSGFVCSGASPDGRLVEFIELADHPFWVGTQAHPEFKSRPNRPAPLFREFVGAALDRAEGRRPHLFPVDEPAARPVAPVSGDGGAARVPRRRRATSAWQGRRIAVAIAVVEGPDGPPPRARGRAPPGRGRRSSRVHDDGTITLVRQYRAALDADLWEIPAGLRDVDGEPTDATARRELAEEVGLRADTLDHLLTFHNSPGFSDEAVVDLRGHRPQRGARRPPGRRGAAHGRRPRAARRRPGDGRRRPHHRRQDGHRPPGARPPPLIAHRGAAGGTAGRGSAAAAGAAAAAATATRGMRRGCGTGPAADRHQRT